MADPVGRSGVRDALASDTTFLTFAGVETFLLFVQKFPLREFCAFEVLDDDDAWNRLCDGLLRPIAETCEEHGFGLITDGMVWRAAPDYLARLGYAEADLERFNRKAIDRIRRFLADHAVEPAILAGELGPRGDAYRAGDVSIDAAMLYHQRQMRALAETAADMAVALTMTSAREATALARLAEDHDLPIGISATVETDGRLPGGMPLGDFINRIDDATSGYPVFHLVNCAHPTHVAPVLHEARRAGASWLPRLCGLRANASTKSHAELDNCTELDRGDVGELAERMAELREAFSFNIVGGCCGTDAEHSAAIARACR